MFVTDLQIENPSDHPATAILTFLPNGPRASSQVSVHLPAFHTLNYFDVIANRFGLYSAVGALRLESTGAPAPSLRMTSRTYAQFSNSTYGQSVSGVPDSDDSNGSRFVTGLVRTEELRSNVGLVNRTGAAQQYEIELHRSDGARVGVARLDPVPPGSQVQWALADIFPGISGGGYTAEFRPLPGSFAPLAYAAVIDNSSGDPAYYPATRPSPTIYLPTAARVTGLNGTYFSSDVSIANMGDGWVLVRVTFMERERDNSSGAPSATFILGPRETRRFEDALFALFGVTETYGALKIESNDGTGLLVSERISTAAAVSAGTVGQQVDPITPNDLMSAGSILGLRQDETFRSNLGVFNPNGFALDVGLLLKDASGTVIASGSVNIPPMSYLQRNLGALFSSLRFPSGQTLNLTLFSPGGSFFPFATIVDNVSQDPTFSPGLR